MFAVENDDQYGTFREITNTKDREDKGNEIVAAVGMVELYLILHIILFLVLVLI